LGFERVTLIGRASVVVAMKQTKLLSRSVVVFLRHFLAVGFLGFTSGLSDLLFVVAIKVLRHFDVFHELHNFLCSFGHGVKSLTIHLALPAFGCSVQANVGNFIGSQRLRGVVVGWQLRDLLMVDAIDMEKVSLHLHVQWLSSFVTQLTFDALQDFVWHESG